MTKPLLTFLAKILALYFTFFFFSFIYNEFKNHRKQKDNVDATSNNSDNNADVITVTDLITDAKLLNDAEISNLEASHGAVQSEILFAGKSNSTQLTAWEDFTVDWKFANSFCKFALKMEKWAPNKKGVICATPLSEELVRFLPLA